MLNIIWRQINSFYGQPAFVNHFGTLQPDGKKIITAPWQSGLSNGALCGEIIGLMINGWAQERFGCRRTMMFFMVVMAAVIFIPVFARSLPVLVVGEVLSGIPWGVFQTLSTAFASEVCPNILRPYLAAYVNICWGMGIFLSSGVVRATLNVEGDLSESRNGS